MNIAHLVLSLDFGGLEKLVIQFCDYLQRAGNKAMIISLSARTALANEARQKGIKILSLQKAPGFDPMALVRLRRMIKDEKIDILHTHNFAPLVYGIIPAKLAGIKTINTRHGRAPLSAHRLIWVLNDYTVAVSIDAHGELLKHNRLHPAKATVIYNGIELPDISSRMESLARARQRERLGLTVGSLVIGTVGRLAREKDHATLFSAFRKVLEANVNAELAIVGGGELESELKDLSRQLNIHTHTKFLGFREDALEIIKTFDVFVLSSRMEGISLTLLEAMAAGKPVVATAVGGNPEVVEEGKTGLLVSVSDAEQMAQAILRIAHDQNLAESFGTAGRKRVEEKFNLHDMVSDYCRIYNSLIHCDINFSSPSPNPSPNPSHQGKGINNLYDSSLPHPTETAKCSQVIRSTPKILVFTNVFRRDFEPQKGQSILEQLKRLKDHFDIRIISARGIHPLVKGNRAGAPPKTISHGFEIFQPTYFTLPKIGVLTAGYDYYLTVLPLVDRLYRHFPFAMILAYWTYPDGCAASLCARRFKVPLLIRPRGSDINIYRQNPFLKYLLKTTLSRADRIIPVSRDLQDKIRMLGVSEEKLSFLANGIDTQDFYPRDSKECRQKLKIPLDRHVILFIGNLIKIKGIEYLLKAIQKLDTADHQRLSFYLIGSGKLEAQILQLTAKLRYLKIHLIGEVPRCRLPLWMNGADLLCLPSLNEGCPNVLLESLACGLPVVATQVGGIPEIINSDRLGILIPPKDADRLAEAMRQALSHAWDKEALRARVNGQTWDAVAEKLREECEMLIRKSKRGNRQ